MQAVFVLTTLSRRLTVADIRGLGQGRAALSSLLTEQGTMIDDTMITRNADHIYMVVNAGCADKDLAHLNANLQRWKRDGKDVALVNLSERNSLIAIQVPIALRIGAHSHALQLRAPMRRAIWFALPPSRRLSWRCACVEPLWHED